MKKIYIFLLFLFLGSNQISAQNWLKGHWVGLGYQYTDSSNWEIDLKYISKQTIQIRYPSLSCKGKWLRVSSSRHKAVYKEKITVGKELCYDNSKVVITKINDEYISVAYFLVNEFKGPVATAVLARKKMKVKTIKRM